MSDPLLSVMATQRGGRPVQGPLESDTMFQQRLREWMAKQVIAPATMAQVFAMSPKPPAPRPAAPAPTRGMIPGFRMPAFLTPGPQRPDESNIANAFRQVLTPQVPGANIEGFIREGFKALPATAAWAMDTPKQAKERQRQAAGKAGVPARADAAAVTAAFAPAGAPANGARGWRNNNPGNIKDGKWARSQPGYAGSDGTFAKFSSAEAGMAAQETLLRNNYVDGKANVGQIVLKYLGGAQNPENSSASQRNYMSYVANRLGLKVGDPVPRERLGELANAMREFENGQQKPGLVNATMAGIDEAGGLASGFDPRFGAAALGEVERARQEALKPSQFVTEIGAPPPVPELVTPAPTDFTKVDQALEKLRPAEITEKEKLKIRRSGWMAGLGRALAQLPDGAGLGKVLATVGGGALAGAAAGDAEVRDRMDKFDEQMARFNVAVLQNETQKAQVARQEAVANAEAINRRALLQYESAYNVWSKNTNTSVVGSNVISSTYKDGKVTTNVLPIASAVNSAFAMQRAEILQGMGSEFNASNRLQAGALNGAIISAASTQAQLEVAGGNSADAAAGIAMAPAFVASRAVQDGAWTGLVDEEAAGALMKEAQGYAVKMGATPGTAAFTEAVQKYIATQLATRAVGDPGFMKNLMGYQSMAMQNMAAEEFQNRTVQRRSGPKGTQTTTTYESE